MLAVLDLGPDLLCGGGALGALHLGDGAHHAVTGTVHLGDDQADLLLQQLGHGSLPGQAGLGGGNEDPHALYGHHNAALVVLGDDALHDSLLFLGGLHVLPALDHVKALLGQGDNTLLVIDADHKGLDLVPYLDQIFHLGGGVISQLGYGNVAGVLGAQIHIDLSRRDPSDNASYLIPRIQSFDRSLQHVSEGFLDLHDFVAHFVTDLLYYPRRRGCARSDTDSLCPPQRRQLQVIYPLDQLDRWTDFPAELRQLPGIGALAVADDHHRAALGGQLDGLFLAF